MRLSCVQALAVFINEPTLSLSRLIDSFDGFVRSFPLYFLKLQPKNTNHSSICVIFVFSSDSSRPLSLRKSVSIPLIVLAVSFESAVMMRSSAYRVRLTLLVLHLVCRSCLVGISKKFLPTSFQYHLMPCWRVLGISRLPVQHLCQ